MKESLFWNINEVVSFEGKKLKRIPNGDTTRENIRFGIFIAHVKPKTNMKIILDSSAHCLRLFQME